MERAKQMRIYLVGISCVGKSTIGKLLSKKLGYQFFDFDVEVEKRTGEHIAALKARCFNTHGYIKNVRYILVDILEGHKEDLVIAMPPSGLFGGYTSILKKHPDVLTVVLHDQPTNILERLIFTDDESMPIYDVVNDSNRKAYLNEIKKDITYYNRRYKTAKIHFYIDGLNADDSVEKLYNQLFIGAES